MAFDSPPAYMDSTTLDAEVFRRATGSLINPAGGIVTAGDLAVTQNGTPNMSVNVGTGQVWVPGTSTSTQGPYYSENKASVNRAIAASSPSNPRIDTVVVQVQDAAYAGSLKQIDATVLTGTPTAGATLANLNGAGTVPASSLVIAYVLVPTSATSIVTADIANVAPRLSLLGQNDTGSVTLPLTPPPPGAGWVTNAPRYVPAYRVVNNMVYLRGSAVNSTGGASGNPFSTPLPSAIRPAATVDIEINGIAGTNEISPSGGWLAGGTASAGGVVYFDGIAYSLS